MRNVLPSNRCCLSQDTIYEYDGENEEWILREETLLQEKYLTGLAWVKKEMIDC